ncbi:MAG: hypothetical protein PWQ77_1669 [Kosmotogales bacterium]|nr:hypothetical protein [Kosmotogales bacterium]
MPKFNEIAVTKPVIRKLQPMKLIAENANSIALAYEIELALAGFDSYEVKEDQLLEEMKTDIQAAIFRGDLEIARTLEYYYQKLKALDRKQDFIQERITKKSKYIGLINRVSNGILKSFDTDYWYQFRDKKQEVQLKLF